MSNDLNDNNEDIVSKVLGGFPYRRTIVVFIDLMLILMANASAFLLRFDGNIPPLYFSSFKRTVLLVAAIRTLSFIGFRLYEGLWRYTSVWDIGNISLAIFSSTAIIYCTFSFVLSVPYPRSIFLLDPLLLLFFATGVRLTRRILKELGGGRREKGILIYGAGDAGEMIVRDMRNNPFYKMDPIGFIDDDASKVGRRIHGVPVLGTRHELKEIVLRKNVQEVLIAMPRAAGQKLREVVKTLERFNVPIMTLPNFRDLMDGKVTVNQIRSLALEDLLQRAPVGLDATPVKRIIEGRRILITGAGGSIGSELCRQIMSMRPEALVMVERHEHSAYVIQKDLRSRVSAGCTLQSSIVDVTDRRAVKEVLAEYRPHIVFHAAAHKHVPMMELNPCEAIKNNVGGTRTFAEESRTAGVERFILISTDKAVNPASVMGASKRVAEFLTQMMGRDGNTCFNAVRFGNVLGSNGSVVPLFLEQIRNGGPVTITHPEMRRYFMLIPEAVQLVLHAATLGESGVVYVLDMGDEFSVVDLARNLIRLSGHIPDEEIPIEFVGLRPGEKLSETLVGSDEVVEQASVEKIRKVRPRTTLDVKRLELQISKLEVAAAHGKRDEVVVLLREIIPTFQHDEGSTATVIGQASHA